ncbi:MAG: alpha-ribazole phosphatase [Edafosvirus sp.]|uniref:Alpha-ribazole phosphatase n=1 Tax=Edafosvirus sp. TaxID=2487765 RepID=A0A3G4ZVW1_9VIRU|nr:MAG: alpha-ribazole phosphatase [Edafosvirus sp.]
MEVYLIRHAESDFNVNPMDDKYADHCHLIQNGINQCNQLKKKLEDIKFDHVILSPLKRCIDTYNLTISKHESMIVLDECREYKQNKCDFLSNEIIVYESEQDILNRTKKFMLLLNELYKTNKYKKIAVFTHADFIFYLTCETVDEEYYGHWLDNTEYKIIIVRE